MASLTGFNNLDSIQEYLDIYVTGLSDMSGLKNLSYAGGFGLSYNDSLTSLDQLEHLSYCKGLSIQLNKSLAKINLPSLKSLGGSTLVIHDNDKLTTLQGLDSLDYTTISELNISQNGQLTYCHIEPVCKYLESGGNAFISNTNACYSVAQVKSKCQSLPTAELFSENPPLYISPNPTHNFLQINTKDTETWSFSIRDLSGNLRYQSACSGSQTINLHDWPAGMYTLRAVSGGRVFAEKVLKQ